MYMGLCFGVMARNLCGLSSGVFVCSAYRISGQVYLLMGLACGGRYLGGPDTTGRGGPDAMDNLFTTERWDTQSHACGAQQAVGPTGRGNHGRGNDGNMFFLSHSIPYGPYMGLLARLRDQKASGSGGALRFSCQIDRR
jgi:hypothetical protein